MAGALVDAHVLLDMLRGDRSGLERLDRAAAGGSRFLSVLTAAELRAGPGGDHPAVGLLVADFVVLSLDLATAELGGRLRRRYGPSHGTGLIDALLAATALTRRLTLVTDNRRHFPMGQLDLG